MVMKGFTFLAFLTLAGMASAQTSPTQFNFLSTKVALSGTLTFGTDHTWLIQGKTRVGSPTTTLLLTASFPDYPGYYMQGFGAFSPTFGGTRWGDEYSFGLGKRWRSGAWEYDLNANRHWVPPYAATSNDLYTVTASATSPAWILEAELLASAGNKTQGGGLFYRIGKPIQVGSAATVISVLGHGPAHDYAPGQLVSAAQAQASWNIGRNQTVSVMRQEAFGTTFITSFWSASYSVKF